MANENQIFIGKGTFVEPGAYIKGPCFIGENCIVRQGAYIRGNVITGNNCVLGHTSEFKNSILLDDVKAAHFAYVGDSILCTDVTLGAGIKCANLKLNGTTIKIKSLHGILETGLRKFGLIAGDYCQIGCNSVTNPGTILGKTVLVSSCVNIKGFVPTKTIVKNKERYAISSME